jgi:hypothetical protein
MSSERDINFARWIFRIAGILGLIEIVPLFFAAGMIGQSQPPAITHLEFYYGFVGIAFAWQIAFLIISRDPVRYVPLMPALFLEKLLFPVAVFALYAQRQVSAQMFPGPILDLAWLALFVVVWLKLRH